MSIKKKINYIKKNTKLPSYVPLPSSMIGTGLSSSAMILYAELLNRASLSQKNDMTDEFGNVYVIYPIDQLSKRLNLSETQIKRLLKELVSAGLLNKRSGGFNKPNHLFVILPGEQKGTAGETTNGTTVGAKKAPLTVHKGPTNYYNKTLDETTYTYDEGESF